jgi:PAS domain S-box-containing protein
MKGARNRLSRFTGIRLMIAIQVFSFLLAIITGFFALEVGSVELNKSLRAAPLYTFQGSIQKLFFRTPTRLGSPIAEELIPVKHIKSALNKMRLTVLICGCVALICGIVLNYAIKNTLNKLARGLSSVARGDFTENLELYSQREIGQVARAYNRMVSSINRHILETSAGATFTVNKDGIIRNFNPMAEIMFRTDYRDTVGSHFSAIFPVTRENRGFVDMIMRGIQKGETASRENVLIVTGEGEKRTTKVATSILSSGHGKLLEVIANFGDFEQAKEIQGQIERMNRLASLGSLVAGLAHEIRTPLGSLKGFTQLLGEDLPEQDKKRKYTEIILKEIERLNKVVEELLSFGQPTKAEFEAMDINQIARDALVLARAGHADKPVQVLEEYDADLPKAVVERDRLLQAMLNILSNAFEATPDDGRIVVRTKRGKEVFEGAAPERQGISQSVVVEFTNTGTTVSYENAKRMFDPFFTTKEGGTGLGLAIAQQVATAHGGNLTVVNLSSSDTEEGVTLRMELPTKGATDRTLNGWHGPF